MDILKKAPEKPSLVCHLCRKKFNKNYNLLRHISTVHKTGNVEDSFICFWCDKTFYLKATLSRHIWTVHEKSKKQSSLEHKLCEWCGKKLRDKYTLSKHISAVHEDSRSKSFVCEWCGKAYYEKQHLSRHILAVHSSDNPNNSFVCKWCNKNYESKSDLTRHVLASHDNHFVCEWCGKKFLQKFNLSRHIKSVHQKSDSKDTFVCEQCGKAFNWKTNLVKHTQTHQARNNQLLKCKICNRAFACERTLMKHNRKQHGLIASDEEFEYYECNECSVKMETKMGIERHIRTIHSLNKEKPLQEKVSHMKCITCNKKYANKRTLVDHYENYHNIKLEFEYLLFSTFEEFEKWLRPCYRKRSTWKTPVYIGKSFCCHRSGFYEDSCEKVNQKRKRLLKISGSKKLQGICPGEVILRQRYSDGSCLVTHQKVHIGHNAEAAGEFKHVYLNKAQKNVVARQLAMGIPRETILQKFIDKNEERFDALNAQDIENIASAFGIENPLSTNNDPVFVDAFIAQHRDSVLLYKRQTESDPNFILIFQDEFQRKCLEKYSHKVVAFDATYETNTYNFLLHTMLVIDTDNEGIPVAFMISNKGDQDVVDTFIRCIKDQVGPIHVRTFMSDMDLVYYKAWIKIMNEPEFSLHCTWHVRKRWKQQLDKLFTIKNTDSKSTSLKFAECKKLKDELRLKLQDLANELDPVLFANKLSSFLSMADINPMYKPFMEYFRERYASKPTFWASCYRMHSGVNCNMHVESFHRVLKYTIAKGKKINTLTAGLYCIDEYIKYRNEQYKIKVVRPTVTTKLRELRKRHCEAEKYAEKNQFTVDVVNNHTWLVGSFPTPTDEVMEMYSVVKVSKKECASASDTCRLICQLCHSCFHDYLCSCPDNALSNNMCKHIHALCLFLNQNTQAAPCTVSIQPDIQYIVQEPQFSQFRFSCENNNHKNNSLKVLREKVAKDFDAAKEKILDTLTSDDEEHWQSLHQEFIRPLQPHLESMRKSQVKFGSPEKIICGKMKKEVENTIFSTKKKESK